MKVILLKDFELLGSVGDIKEVKRGYARNFLIPKGIAQVATPARIKSFEEIKKQKSRKIQKEIESAKVLAATLENLPLHIKAKAVEENKIYGSITSQMISDLLRDKGYENIDKRKIHIHEPIKTLGEHIVDVKLHSTVIAKVKIVVDKEESEYQIEKSSENNT